MSIQIRNTKTNKLIATTAKPVRRVAKRAAAAITPSIWASWKEQERIEALAEGRREEQVSYWNGEAEIHFLNGLGVLDQSCDYVQIQYAKAQECWNNAALWMNTTADQINAEYALQFAPVNTNRSFISRIASIIR